MGSEMCIRDRSSAGAQASTPQKKSVVSSEHRGARIQIGVELAPRRRKKKRVEHPEHYIDGPTLTGFHKNKKAYWFGGEGVQIFVPGTH